MDRLIYVHVDLDNEPVLVGRLWSRLRRDRESATFEYDGGWLQRSDRFSLEPALTLGEGPHHTERGKALFGAIGDSAPDRWGRVLMRRAERQNAEKEGRVPRTLLEADFLLMVDDEARQGALRFSLEPGGPFLALHEDAKRIPPLLQLGRLLSASEKVVDEADSDEDLRLLLAPGSSLGGARPKASVRDRDERLLIAKFPQKNDEHNMVLWEAIALQLAQRAGIDVPDWRIEEIAGKSVLLLRRFDRLGNGYRVPFLSAMSMLGATDNETRSYLEVVDALRQYGSLPEKDMHELWRRIVFSILISNTDDHLRNHGFLYDGAGWTLSPAYDLNPTPVDIKPRILSTAIDEEDTRASLKLAFSVIDYFELEMKVAQKIVAEVARAVSHWRDVARACGIKNHEVERMASAFEHDDAKAALELTR